LGVCAKLRGIIVGLIAASVSSRFYKIQLPTYLGCFAGNRSGRITPLRSPPPGQSKSPPLKTATPPIPDLRFGRFKIGKIEFSPGIDRIRRQQRLHIFVTYLMLDMWTDVFASRRSR
jgi:hypothetical protein